MGGKHINWAELLPKLNGLVMGGMSYTMAAKIIGINASTYANYRYSHKDKLAKPSADIGVYKARIAELEAQIAELKALREELPEPPHPRWKPEREKLYYTINTGYACAGSNTWDGDNVDGDIYSLGFVFKTEAEAEFAIERLKVLAEMQEWAGKWNDTFVLTYVGNDDFVQISSVLMSRNTFGEMRFATKEDAEGCIKAVGEDRIKKYYFMIPEEETNNG